MKESIKLVQERKRNIRDHCENYISTNWTA